MVAHPKLLQRNRDPDTDCLGEIPEYFRDGIVGGTGE
jgi:hypothetical protein